MFVRNVFQLYNPLLLWLGWPITCQMHPDDSQRLVVDEQVKWDVSFRALRFSFFLFLTESNSRNSQQKKVFLIPTRGISVFGANNGMKLCHDKYPVRLQRASLEIYDVIVVGPFAKLICQFCQKCCRHLLQHNHIRTRLLQHIRDQRDPFVREKSVGVMDVKQDIPADNPEFRDI